MKHSNNRRYNHPSLADDCRRLFFSSERNNTLCAHGKGGSQPLREVDEGGNVEISGIWVIASCICSPRYDVYSPLFIPLLARCDRKKAVVNRLFPTSQRRWDNRGKQHQDARTTPAHPERANPTPCRPNLIRDILSQVLQQVPFVALSARNDDPKRRKAKLEATGEAGPDRRQSPPLPPFRSPAPSPSSTAAPRRRSTGELVDL